MMKPEWAYLDLLKKALSFSLWPEPDVPLDVLDSFGTYSPTRQEQIRSALDLLLPQLPTGFVLGLHRPELSFTDTANGSHWPVLADTMVGRKRLDSLQSLVESVFARRIPGSLLEAGVWRGGCSILMKAMVELYGEDRAVYLLDSFAGLPKPELPELQGEMVFSEIDYLAVSEGFVRARFEAYGITTNGIHFVSGWFKDTVPALARKIGPIAILRLDGDMYESTKVCLDHLYDKVSPGGFIIIDDYMLFYCRKAVDEFRAARGIDDPLSWPDTTSVFWQKGYGSS